jgi:hypothetical protein
LPFDMMKMMMTPPARKKREARPRPHRRGGHDKAFISSTRRAQPCPWHRCRCVEAVRHAVSHPVLPGSAPLVWRERPAWYFELRPTQFYAEKIRRRLSLFSVANSHSRLN